MAVIYAIIVSNNRPCGTAKWISGRKDKHQTL